MDNKKRLASTCVKRAKAKNVRAGASSAYVKRLKAALVKKEIHSNTIQQKNHNEISKVKPKQKGLADDARERLESARFRYLNEKLYTTSSSEAWNFFQEDPESFGVYHKGFKNQVLKWPVNPLDIIISDILKGPKHWVVADFGCGEAQMAHTIPNQVHSFDLVAANDKVTACDMASVPLAMKAVDVAVFCLSLMGSNIHDFLKEANRVLRIGGLLYVAEVESRCKNIQEFLKNIERFGFQLKENSLQKYFFLAKFNKIQNMSPKATLPRLYLKPCLYKKR
ncbi:putative ribosomal R-processing protein 8 [Daphnia sinensis]|uniref:Ribosomal RNA-processing protein 8 n=1 Tax=Daphnia sinensis TaxID=1820382 RepID=A0AAD5KMI1_9CRUS|nr:putative ribosomal R-processing protein 8 [Daphnia sinensis]